MKAIIYLLLTFNVMSMTKLEVQLKHVKIEYERVKYNYKKYIKLTEDCLNKISLKNDKIKNLRNQINNYVKKHGASAYIKYKRSISRINFKIKKEEEHLSKLKKILELNKNYAESNKKEMKKFLKIGKDIIKQLKIKDK